MTLADRLRDTAEATADTLLHEAAAAARELDVIRATLERVMLNAFDPDLSTERNLHKHLISSWS